MTYEEYRQLAIRLNDKYIHETLFDDRRTGFFVADNNKGPELYFGDWEYGSGFLMFSVSQEYICPVKRWETEYEKPDRIFEEVCIVFEDLLHWLYKATPGECLPMTEAVAKLNKVPVSNELHYTVYIKPLNHPQAGELVAVLSIAGDKYNYHDFDDLGEPNVDYVHYSSGTRTNIIKTCKEYIEKCKGGIPPSMRPSYKTAMNVLRQFDPDMALKLREKGNCNES